MMIIIELDDGKILTGKPDQFDDKNPWFPVDFPLNQSNETGILWDLPSGNLLHSY